MKNKSIDPGQRRAMLDSQYSTIINQDIENVALEEVNKLIKQLLSLNLHGNKKDLHSSYGEKANKLMEKFKNEELTTPRYNQMISYCSSKWRNELPKLGIKQITVWDQYTNHGLHMITWVSSEINTVTTAIFNDILNNWNYEISSNQMSNAFTYAAIQLGILKINRSPIYKRKETIKTVNTIEKSRFKASEILFTSWLLLTLNYLNPNNIEDGDYFEITYLDPQFTTNLVTTLYDSSWRRKSSWSSQEYKERKNSDNANWVEIEKIKSA